jgi:hypothetical protein
MAWRRLPLLVPAIALLALGVWAGLVRIGWQLPQGRLDLVTYHGPLLVFGFLGTVVSLERAVALRRRWGYAAPGASLVGTALLLAGVRQGIGELFLLLAGLVLVALFALILRSQPTAAHATLALGAVGWVVSVGLWLGGQTIVQIVPWWAAFLVLTIAGERLELAALGRLTRAGRAWFLALNLVLGVALVLTAAGAGAGPRLLGIGWIALAAWLFRFDIARRTIRRRGLPRFAAIALLAGYFWLAVGGVAWTAYGEALFGPHRDIELHAIFVGFVFSMIFGHAPVIFPGVLGVLIPFRRIFYVHLSVLHVGLALRVAGDLDGSARLARIGGLVNATAILLFLIATAMTAGIATARRRR